jgi:hypothetical protein
LTSLSKLGLVPQMSQTGTNGITVTYNVTCYTTSGVTYASNDVKLTPKERRRRESTRKWLEKCRVRFEASHKLEMARIHAESKANAWRPHVSSGKVSNPYEFNFWTITPGEENEMDRLWRTTVVRYKKGWCGMTLNDPSLYERERIDAFIKKLGKKNVLIDHDGTWFEWDESCGHIGSFTAVQMGVWFRTLDDHNAFVALIQSFPKRDQMFILGDAADVGAIRHLLEGENYLIVKGSHGVALTMPTGNNAVLVKMFVG